MGAGAPLLLQLHQGFEHRRQVHVRRRPVHQIKNRPDRGLSFLRLLSNARRIVLRRRGFFVSRPLSSRANPCGPRPDVAIAAHLSALLVGVHSAVSNMAIAERPTRFLTAARQTRRPACETCRARAAAGVMPWVGEIFHDDLLKRTLDSDR